jgi:hypothetical protein
MGDAAALDVEMAAAGAGGAATRALLGEYTTPARWASELVAVVRHTPLSINLADATHKSRANKWLGLCNALAW